MVKMILFNPFKKDGIYITFCNKGVVFKLYFKDISSVAEFMHSFLNTKK
jgi:hypothetical protein